jgi:hypothetical protein
MALLVSDQPSSVFCAFLILILTIFEAPCLVMGAQGQALRGKATVSSGWHPWYEIKADPEDSKNLIICGTKWDSARNNPFGFVYASSDGGKTWQSALVDRTSTWVTEHSCAFGSNHQAFFISGVSKVIDGKPHHELGRTRILVSGDAGQHWAEAATTGWTDYSTSAVSFRSSRLYTFFNSFDTTLEPGRSWGSEVGLLLFSSTDRKITGPFFDPSMQRANYRGVFPSDAIALKSGAVVALFYGRRPNAHGGEADIGVMRADETDKPLVKQTIVTRVAMNSAEGCDTLSDNSLAYDRGRNRLLLIYVAGCTHRNQVVLTSSDDEGRTWTKSVVVTGASNVARMIHNPSLLVDSSGRLDLLWREGRGVESGRWLFSSIQDFKLVEPPIELSRGIQEPEVSNDALRTVLTSPEEQSSGIGASSADSAIAVGVVSETNSVWRSNAAIAMEDRILAIWSSRDHDGMRLYSGILGGQKSSSEGQVGAGNSSESDVTRETLLLYGYGGFQHFDPRTGILKICLSLANRGDESLKLPIRLKVEEVGSGAGAITILNATNGVAREGAEWDISESLTGDLIPPRTNTHPFCFLFHIESSSKEARATELGHLLLLRLKVVACREDALHGGSQARN